MYPRFFKRPLDFLCAFAIVACLGIPVAGWTANSPVISANPYASLQNGNAYLQQGIPLLLEYHGLTTGDQRQRFGYPQRNYGFRTATATTHHRFASSPTDFLQYGLDAHIAAGAFAAYRDFGSGATSSGTTFATTQGNTPSNPAISDNDRILPGAFLAASAAGFIDSLDFDFNAAFYAEHHNHANAPTADRQETDWVLWDNEGRETINYKRMQAHIGLNYAWLRLELGRDALHWGPGFFNNLTLNRQAVPYNYFSIDMVFGPLRVISFYSPLTIDSVGSRTHAHGDRNLYGHRYELALGNVTFGMSEIQTIYNENSAWLLVPVYPLFMEKGNYSELNNNGTLAFDANYRIMRTARIYGEFYMDDFDSPITVIENEYLNSQWALMLGAQVVHDFKLNKHDLQLGSIFEYARVDQRVYTHYEPGEAQIANAGYPLGNQLGPNSQSIDWMIYAQINNALFVGVRNKWQWKGNVYGSELNGSWIGSGQNIKKDFLGGAKMRYSVTPMLAYNAERWQCSGAVTLFAEKKGEFNFSVSL